MARRPHPRFVSDISRGYLGLGVSLAAIFAGILAYGLFGSDDIDRSTLLTTALFARWALVSFIASALTLLVFVPMSHQMLHDSLRATTPTTTRAKFLWLLSGGGATYWAITGSAIAVVTLLTLVVNRSASSNPTLLYLGIAVVVGSLILIFTSYAVRYARQDSVAGGVEFAGTERPRFGDYLYLAIQVATTFSTSDVTITTRAFRRIVSVNSLVSFAYNSIIVALLVSVLINAAQ